jgi:uncharacterized membrane protein
MKVFRVAQSVIPPFFEGIARNFDFAGSIVDFPGSFHLSPRKRKNNYSPFPEINLDGSAFIPPPDILAKYNSIIPGLAERIVAHAEKQSLHRADLERKLLISNIRKSYLGLVFGFLICSLGVGGGIWLTFSGFNLTGIVFSSASLVSLVMSFIYGSQNKKNIPGRIS